MIRTLVVALSLFTGQQLLASDLYKHFELDLVSIEAEFSVLNEVILQLEEGAQDAPSSNSFEIPVDSTSQDDYFPIYGFPTFWAVFIPSCAASCCTFNPLTGSCVGLVSAGSIYYFTGNREETRAALAGCAVSQIPVVVGMGLYISLLSGGI